LLHRKTLINFFSVNVETNYRSSDFLNPVFVAIGWYRGLQQPAFFVFPFPGAGRFFFLPSIDHEKKFRTFGIFI